MPLNNLKPLSTLFNNKQTSKSSLDNTDYKIILIGFINFK